MPRRNASREPLSLFPDAPRWCAGCQEHHPPSAFGRGKHKDGLQSSCIEHRRSKGRARYWDDPRKYAVQHVRKTYGIDLHAAFKMHNGKCAVTGIDMVLGARGQPNCCTVDHCHDTNKVRGLVAHKINVVLRSDVTSAELRLAADYLDRMEKCGPLATSAFITADFSSPFLTPERH